jgi:ADP-heptose:LPS heptosyltransferase
VQKQGPDQVKNCPPALADELTRRCRARGLSVACCGHPDYAYCPPSCADFRRVDLRESVAAIASARLVAGENSGATHLANLCGKPTVLWANDQWRIDYSLRWNPFRVPIYVAANNTCQPAPEVVTRAIAEALNDLETRTDSFRQACYTHCQFLNGRHRKISAPAHRHP